MCSTRLFYPRSPCGERLGSVVVELPMSNFLSTLSLRRATLVSMFNRPDRKFSIHALLAESDILTGRLGFLSFPFLSTLSLRRATLATWQSYHVRGIFYPRSPCGERRVKFQLNFINQDFLSTLSLRRATRHCMACMTHMLFLSTLSLRRATVNGGDLLSCFDFSIHALLAESDWSSPPATTPYWIFYPRSPCGERRWRLAMIPSCLSFLSTLSLRRATGINRNITNG